MNVLPPKKQAAVLERLSRGVGVRQIARELKVNKVTVMRLRNAEMARLRERNTFLERRALDRCAGLLPAVRFVVEQLEVLVDASQAPRPLPREEPAEPGDMPTLSGDGATLVEIGRRIVAAAAARRGRAARAPARVLVVLRVSAEAAASVVGPPGAEEAAVLDALSRGMGVLKIARELKVNKFAIMRLRDAEIVRLRERNTVLENGGGFDRLVVEQFVVEQFEVLVEANQAPRPLPREEPAEPGDMPALAGGGATLVEIGRRIIGAAASQRGRDAETTARVLVVLRVSAEAGTVAAPPGAEDPWRASAPAGPVEVAPFPATAPQPPTPASAVAEHAATDRPAEAPPATALATVDARPEPSPIAIGPYVSPMASAPVEHDPIAGGSLEVPPSRTLHPRPPMPTASGWTPSPGPPQEPASTPSGSAGKPLPIARLRRRRHVFRCVPLTVTLSVGSCLDRQATATVQAEGRGARAFHARRGKNKFPGCANCPIGQRIARQVAHGATNGGKP